MLEECEVCTARYSVGAPRCPQCGTTNSNLEENMAKISLHGGPSDASSDIPVDPDTGRQPLPVQRATDPTGTVETEADRVDRAHEAAILDADAPPLTEDEQADQATEQGGDPSSQPQADRAAGTDSSASSEKPPTSSLPAATSSGSSAPTTGSHSAPDLTGASTVPSTATGPTPLLLPPAAEG